MKSNLTICINIPVAGICHFLPQHLYSIFLSILKGAGCLGSRFLRSPASWFLFRFCPWACDSHKDMYLDLPQKKPPKRAQLTESLQLPHLWTHPRLAPGPHSLAFLPITGLAPKGSLCSRTPNWPGQDAFKSMLTFEALHLNLPSFLLSPVSGLPQGLKAHPQLLLLPALLYLESLYPSTFLGHWIPSWGLLPGGKHS